MDDAVACAAEIALSWRSASGVIAYSMRLGTFDHELVSKL